jgi:hypothetical protein
LSADVSATTLTADGAAPTSRSHSADRGFPPATAVALCAVLAGFIALLVYGRAAGYVYSEDSEFATEFGIHSWYHSLNFLQILGEYFKLGHGWYRPTGFYLIPYLLRLDYFEPAEQITLDIATLVIASLAILAFIRRVRLLVALIATLSVLLAPSLYQVTYGAQADSFYIIFGLAFLWIADRLFYGQDSGQRRAALRVALVLAFLLTITTKEIGCLVALLVIPFLLVRGPDQLTKRRVIATIRFASPFLAIVVAYGVVYKTQVNVNNPTYSTHFNIGRSLNFINLIFWTLGFRSPRHTFTNWVPNWSHTEAIVQATLLLSLLAGVALTWRRFRIWRILLVLLSALVSAVAIASVGGIPYHGFPLVVMYGLVILFVLDAACDRICTTNLRKPGMTVAATVGITLATAMVFQGHSTYGGVIDEGPQTAYLEASTQLFYGSTLVPVRDSVNPLFVFQDCLGGLDNALKFYARSPTGTELKVVGAFSYPSAQPAMQAAYSVRRPVFAAICTGTPDPWYVLREYEGPERGLVPVSQ